MGYTDVTGVWDDFAPGRQISGPLNDNDQVGRPLRPFFSVQTTDESKRTRSSTTVPHEPHDCNFLTICACVYIQRKREMSRPVLHRITIVRYNASDDITKRAAQCSELREMGGSLHPKRNIYIYLSVCVWHRRERENYGISFMTLQLNYPLQLFNRDGDGETDGLAPFLNNFLKIQRVYDKHDKHWMRKENDMKKMDGRTR